MSERSRCATWLAAAFLAGCVSTPGDGPHERPLAAADVGLVGAAYQAPVDDWWRSLDDPQLDRLVQEALARNPGLAGALARVRIAREAANVVGSTNDPQLSADADAVREKVSANWIFPPPYGGSTFWNAQLGLNLGWNLDFWGRQASLIEQSQRVADAAALDAAGMNLLLSSSVSQAYVELARASQLEALAELATAQRNRLLELARQRVRAGLDTEVELRGAEANVALVAVEREQARVAQETARHALAALAGHGADFYDDIQAPTLQFERALALPDALPLNLLAHRPDVAAARTRAEAAQAGRAAAKASFYPNVNLAAFAGWTAIGLDRLFDSDSQQYSAGAAIHLPLFDAGRLRAEYRKSGAEIDVATAAYNDTVLRSVRESADQLARLRSLDQQLADQARALQAAERAFDLAEQRYGAGLASYLTVLSAETQVLAARRQRINLLADRTQARVALIVALGGSFEETT
jgi:NodT family efflux transporter outer membrane factor (OMF) lipoprotein